MAWLRVGRWAPRVRAVAVDGEGMAGEGGSPLMGGERGMDRNKDDPVLSQADIKEGRLTDTQTDAGCCEMGR